jgi:hypothetical protein
MTGPTNYPRILQSWHDHDGGVTLFITRHDEGAGPVYRLEDQNGNQWARGNEAKVKEDATRRLFEMGHQCAGNCRDWFQAPN